MSKEMYLALPYSSNEGWVPVIQYNYLKKKMLPYKFQFVIRFTDGGDTIIQVPLKQKL